VDRDLRIGLRLGSWKCWIIPLLLLGLSLSACDRESSASPEVSRQSPVVPLDTATVRIETDAGHHLVSVEIAETGEQRGIGLMARNSLPADEGMLLLYSAQQDSSAAFYMFRTLIPLDIAFFDDEGRIVAIRQMEPCTSPVADWCERYAPGVPYWGALEVNSGYFAERGIGLGDRVVLIRSGGGSVEPTK
jgi:uncharacterized membrane protein (UPF0127 family)